jgi:uncharacterized protein YhhL (DUF1145 family)
MFGSSLPPVVGRSAGVLFMLFVFASYSGIQHVLTIINKVSGDVLSLVYSMLPMSLNCHRSVSCVPNVTNVSELSSCCLLCTQCYQCLWIVFVLSLVYPMLPMSLNCLRPVSCVHNVTSVSELSSSCLLCTQCYQCLWIVIVLSLVYPMLPVSLNSETLVTLGTQETGRRQFRDTGNIGYTRDRTKTIQRHW